MIATADNPTLEGTAWVLAELPGRSLLAGRAVTLRFAEGRAQGTDGCNRYGVPFLLKGSKLEVTGPGLATQMACSPEVTQQAAAYMSALTNAQGYRVTEGRLELLGGDGKPLATLVAQSSELAGTAWKATGINNGKGAVASLVAGSTVTLAFSSDGQASGSAGCNRYTARYEQDGENLRFLAPAGSRRACVDDRLMQQEQAFLAALRTVATARFEGNRVELRTAEGSLAVALARDGGE
jgi:heat shock protein HslJ